MSTQRSIDQHTARRIAVESVTDPRTVLRFVAGEPVRGMTAHRIREALQRMGLGHIALPATEAHPAA
jgi:hypothetical protein